GGEDGGEGGMDDMGGIESSAQADLEQQHVRRTARKQQEARRRRDLEYGDGRTGVDALAFVERVAELLVRSEPSLARRAEPEALVEAHEMRRSIDVHAQARRLQDRAHESDGRALAVGAGDMDRGRRPRVGMSERGENGPDAVERQIDAFGM